MLDSVTFAYVPCGLCQHILRSPSDQKEKMNDNHSIGLLLLILEVKRVISVKSSPKKKSKKEKKTWVHCDVNIRLYVRIGAVTLGLGQLGH